MASYQKLHIVNKVYNYGADKVCGRQVKLHLLSLISSFLNLTDYWGIANS